MFSSEETDTNITGLVEGVKRYLRLQKDYVLLEVVEKMTVLLSTILLIFILVVFGMMALFYALFALAYWMAPFVGGMTVSFAIITLVMVLITVFVYLLRSRLISKPIAVFIAKLLFSSRKK